MRFFVYGKLKSDQTKAWMIPFSKTKPYILYGFKMYMRPEGTAGMKRGHFNDFVIGEVRETKWTVWPLNKLLLWFLDLNEGTSIGFYKRILVTKNSSIIEKSFHMWTYLFKRSTEGCKVIKEWRRYN